MSTLTSLVDNLTSLKTSRDSIRSKLFALGIGTESDSLSVCETNITAIENNTAKTGTATAVTGSFVEGATGAIYGKPGEGYNAANTLISIPVLNLAAANIKTGVSIGGVTGTYGGTYTVTELQDTKTLCDSI